jgi:cation diffusion facilitator CzcD-associated flavoprotein CzcO
VRMRDGSFHELDVLALATGFRTDRFIRPAVVKGVGGITLDDVWTGHPKAYYAIGVPGFPNFFMLNGPTGPSGNFSLIDIAEKQWAYVDQLLELLRSGRAATIAPKQKAMEDYEVRRNKAALSTVFASGCTSWYLDESGEVQVWPWSYDHFVEVMTTPVFEDYDLAPVTAPGATVLS